MFAKFIYNVLIEMMHINMALIFKNKILKKLNNYLKSYIMANIYYLDTQDNEHVAENIMHKALAI